MKHYLIFKETDGTVCVSSRIGSPIGNNEGETVFEFDSYAALKEFANIPSEKKFSFKGEIIDKTEDELSEAIKKNLKLRNVIILQELRDKFMDAQLKCFTDNLIFAEKYSEMSIEREGLLQELNDNETAIAL